MSDNSKPIYVGNGKMIYSQSGDGLKLSINLNQLWEALKTDEGKAAIFKSDTSGYTYVNLVAWPLKAENVDERRTHSVKLDTWKPNESREHDKAKRESQKVAPESTGDDDLPF